MAKKDSFHRHPHFYIGSVVAVIALLAIIIGVKPYESAVAGEAIRSPMVMEETDGINKELIVTEKELLVTDKIFTQISECQRQISNCNLATQEDFIYLQNEINYIKRNYVLRGEAGDPCEDDLDCMGLFYCVPATKLCQSTAGSGCFLASSKVLMGDNTQRNIEKVKVSDEIVSFDEETGQNVVAKVSKTFVHDSSEHIIINKEIKVTKNHPLLLNGKWSEAGSAKLGDTLINISGELVKITSLEEIKDKVKVYNLEVEGTHTYFVEGILVHNK